MFKKNEIGSDRYSNGSEVECDGLRTLEERKAKLSALRRHLAEGATQAEQGQFVTQSLKDMLDEFKPAGDGKPI